MRRLLRPICWVWGHRPDYGKGGSQRCSRCGRVRFLTVLELLLRRPRIPPDQGNLLQIPRFDCKDCLAAPGAIEENWQRGFWIDPPSAGCPRANALLEEERGKMEQLHAANSYSPRFDALLARDAALRFEFESKAEDSA